MTGSSERSERGRTYASAYMQCVTMNVYRAECVTELGLNLSEPEAREASVGRTYASASTLEPVIKASISRKLRQISKKKPSSNKCLKFDFPLENIKKSIE